MVRDAAGAGADAACVEDVPGGACPKRQAHAAAPRRRRRRTHKSTRAHVQLDVNRGWPSAPNQLKQAGNEEHPIQRIEH